MAKIHLNGRLIEATAARIDPADRGLLLADGLFETLRVYGGRAFQLAAHLARLAAGAVVLDLSLPPAGDIARAVAETLAANDLREGSLRITVTRGPGERGLLPPAHPSPTLLIVGHPSGKAPPAAMTAHVSSIRRNEHSPLSRLKSLAYLDNVLARAEARAAGAAYRCHEFHYATIIDEGPGDALFDCTDARGQSLGAGGRSRGRIFGSFLHLIDRGGWAALAQD